jgi:CBS domain-containing protein
MRVRDIMTSPAVSLPATAPVAEAAAIMVSHRIGSVVVVDPDDRTRVVGMFTEAELELAETPVPFAIPSVSAPRLHDLWAQSPEQLAEALAELAGRAIGEVMTTQVHATDADTGVWEAMSRMAELELTRLVVLEGDRLVGLVARHDLLKAVIALAGRPDPRAGDG